MYSPRHFYPIGVPRSGSIFLPSLLKLTGNEYVLNERSYPVMLYGNSESKRHHVTMCLVFKNMLQNEPFVYVTSDTDAYLDLMEAAHIHNVKNTPHLINVLSENVILPRIKAQNTFDPINSWIDDINSCNAVFGEKIGDVLHAMASIDRNENRLIDFDMLLNYSNLNVLESALALESHKSAHEVIGEYLSGLGDDFAHADNCSSLDEMFACFADNPCCSLTPEVDVESVFKKRESLVIVVPEQIKAHSMHSWVANWSMAMTKKGRPHHAQDSALPNEFFELDQLGLGDHEKICLFGGDVTGRTIYSLEADYDHFSEAYIDAVVEASKTFICMRSDSLFPCSMIASAWNSGINIKDVQSMDYFRHGQALAWGRISMRHRYSDTKFYGKKKFRLNLPLN